MEEILDRIPFSYLDNLVGKVAGSICMRLSEFPDMNQKHFVLLPAVTYKVKLCFTRAKHENRWSDMYLADMARDIRISIEPLMWALDFSTDLVNTLGPEVERTAYKTLEAMVH